MKKWMEFEGEGRDESERGILIRFRLFIKMGLANGKRE